MQKKFSLIIYLLIFSIIIFISYNVYDLNDKSSENEYIRLINNLNADTTDFTLWISEKRKIVNTAKDVVDNFTYEEIIQWSTQNPYLNINNGDPDISQIYIGLANGEFVTGGQWVPPENYDPRTRVWYQEAVEADRTIISDVYIDRETGDRTVTISSPLYLDNNLAGVISADVFMNDINQWLRNKISGRDIYTYLIDRDGTVIAHTLRPELVGMNLYRDEELFDNFFNRPEIFLDYLEEASNSNQSVKMEYVADGWKTRGIIRRIEDSNWTISVAAVEVQNFRNFFKLNRTSILFNLAVLIIVLFLLLLAIRIKKELVEKNLLLTIDNERDFLTGIFNRRYFDLYLDKLWNSDGDSFDISLLMVDIDHFKGYNDTYGHIKGDEVLKTVTEIISHVIRRQDVFTRYGGEEFVIVLDHVSVEDTRRIADKIVGAVYEGDIENSSSPFGRVTISIGIASSKYRDDISVQQFVKMADEAMYAAKDNGRNGLSIYSETD